jgi:hypothetical protein
MCSPKRAEDEGGHLGGKIPCNELREQVGYVVSGVDFVTNERYFAQTQDLLTTPPDGLHCRATPRALILNDCFLPFPILSLKILPAKVDCVEPFF